MVKYWISSIFLFLSSLIIAQDIEIHNLIFEGGGMKGLAYTGALEVLEEYSMLDSLENVGGTSAGAIFALLISLGYSAKEATEIIYETSFREFNDGGIWLYRGFRRLRKQYGWHKGETFHKWITEKIEMKTGNGDITFKEMKEEGYINLYVTATSLNEQKLLIFSHESYPEMKVNDAIRISMSIPLYFTAKYIDSIGNIYKKNIPDKDLDLVVDGGVIANYPITLFDKFLTDSSGRTIRIPNPHTVGFRVDRSEQVELNYTGELAHQNIKNLHDYLDAFRIFIYENLNRSELTSEDWERTVSIPDMGIGVKPKKLSDEEKNSLIESGRTCTEMFLKEKGYIKKVER